VCVHAKIGGEENGTQSEMLGEASSFLAKAGKFRQKVAAGTCGLTPSGARRGKKGGRYMGGPPLVVRKKASMPSKVIFGPKKQRPSVPKCGAPKVHQSKASLNEN